MRVFDFDNTIYKGESTFDFAVFVMKKKKSLLRYLPGIVQLLLKYHFCKMDVNTFQNKIQEYTQIFLKNKEMIQDLVDEFWLLHLENIYPHMLKKIHKDDVILTTSPDFLMKGISDILPTNKILTTELDLENGCIKYFNFRENKVKNFKRKYGQEKISELYTDSYNDQPLMDIAKHVFLVKNGVPKKIK